MKKKSFNYGPTYLETLFYAGKFRNKVVKIILTKEDLMARKINEFCFLNHHQHSEKKFFQIG